MRNECNSEEEENELENPARSAEYIGTLVQKGLAQVVLHSCQSIRAQGEDRPLAATGQVLFWDARRG